MARSGRRGQEIVMDFLCGLFLPSPSVRKHSDPSFVTISLPFVAWHSTHAYLKCASVKNKPLLPVHGAFRLIIFLLAAATIGPLTATAHELEYGAFLSGPNESPPNASPGTGAVRVTIDLDLFTMRIEA